jgi:hypothetical protein
MTFNEKTAFDKMYSMTKNDDFKFKNQSYQQLYKLISLHCCNTNDDILYSVLTTETQNLLSTNYPVTVICKADDADDYENYRGKSSGTNNIYSIDENKQFSACLLYRTDNYVIPDLWDEFIDFDFNLHSNIPNGFYIVEPGSYGDDETLVKFNLNLYSHSQVKKLLRDGQNYTDKDINYTKLTFDKIKKVMISRRFVRNDHFKKKQLNSVIITYTKK